MDMGDLGESAASYVRGGFTLLVGNVVSYVILAVGSILVALKMDVNWLARRVGLPYLRIDPLKVDVARVAEVMSINYAERRKALPVQFGLNEITIATSEPLAVARAHLPAGRALRTLALLKAPEAGDLLSKVLFSRSYPVEVVKEAGRQLANVNAPTFSGSTSPKHFTANLNFLNKEAKSWLLLQKP
mgnify:CR=1 FL=1